MKTLDEAVNTILSSAPSDDPTIVMARVHENLSRYPFLTELLDNPRVRQAIESMTCTLLWTMQGIQIVPTVDGKYVAVQNPGLDLAFEIAQFVTAALNTGLMIGIEMEKAEVNE
jgi:hypothetical protein